MIIKKRILGHDVEFELVKLREYERYSTYQIYKIVRDRYNVKKRIPMYRETFTDLQIREILDKGYWVPAEIYDY